MNIDFLKPVLGEELFGQVSEKLADAKGITLVNTADGSYVPKAKLDEERTVSKGYKTQLDELNGKLSEMQKDKEATDTLKGQITQLQNDIATKDAEMKAQRLQYTVKDSLRSSKAKNPDVVIKMIDMGKITEKDGQFIGLNDQIEAIKKSDAYLFEEEQSPSGGADPHQDPSGEKPGVNATVNDMIRRAAGR